MKLQTLNHQLFTEVLDALRIEKSAFLALLQCQTNIGSILSNKEIVDHDQLAQLGSEYIQWDNSNRELLKNALNRFENPLLKMYEQIQEMFTFLIEEKRTNNETDISIISFKDRLETVRKTMFHKNYLLVTYIEFINRILAEEELVQNEVFLKEAQAVAKLGAYSIDIATGNWTGSEELNRILGIDSYYEKNYEGGQAIVHPDWRGKMADYFYDEVITKRQKWDIEYKIIRVNDQEERWVHGLGDLKVNEKNEPVTLIATVQDITDRKYLENELIEANEFSKSLIHSMQDGFAIVNSAGVQTQVNDAFCKMTGFEMEELIGTSAPFKYWPPEEYEHINAALSTTFSTAFSNDIHKFQLTFMRKNGERFPVVVAPVPIKNKEGVIVNFAATIHDISQIQDTQNQLKQYNEALQKSKSKAEENEAHYRILVENAPEALVVFEMDSQKFIHASESALVLFKMTLSELLSKGVADISPTYQANGKLSSEEAMVKISEAIDGGKPSFEWTHLNSEGKLIPCEVILVRLPAENKILIRGSISDITERKKAEEEIKISNDRHLSILNNIDAGVVIHAPDTSIIHCNHKAMESLGLTEDQIFGKKAMDPDWKFLDENSTALSFKMYPVNQVIFTKKPIKNFIVGVNRPIHKDIIWALVNGFPVLNKDGEIIEIIISFIDITYHRRLEIDINERKLFEIELKAAKDKAEESEKLKTAFLQNMSHEIRTPLNAISGFLQLLDKPDLSPEKRKSFTSIIINSSNQLLSIVSDILTISSIETKQEKINITAVNINSIIVDLLAIFKLQASNQNVFLYSKQNLPDYQAEILSDKVKLTQILTNLLSNALKFTHKGSIEFGYALHDDTLEFYVKDSGIGIAADQKQRIFGRFQQADGSKNAQYAGTGLGLAISKAFVELLGGEIWVDSVLDEGSIFYFSLPYKPVHDFDDKSNKTSIIEKPIITILIAEDVEINFLLLEELFNNMGCRTIHAKNGQEAVDICATNESITLVMMDIKMPILDGYSAAKLIKKTRPDLPIIAQSGYAFDDEREKYGEVFNEYISKPFDIEDLEILTKKYILQVQ